MKNILITGASRGIGAEFAKLLSEDYNLVLVARNKFDLEKVKLECSNNNKIKIISLDLTKENELSSIFKDNKIDILINNAGFGDYNFFTNSDINKQLSMIDLNIKALTKLTYLFLSQRNKNLKSYILNIGSLASFLPGPNMSVYFATKAYVLSFSEALMEELKHENISISILCPGPTKTNFADISNIKNFKNNITSAETVAKIGIKGLFNHKKIIIVKFSDKISIFLLRFLPKFIIRKLMSIQMNK